jgi:hypothetical protein
LVGIDENKRIKRDDESIKVYPNPANSHFIIEINDRFPNKENMKCSIFDLFGRKVEEVEMPDNKTGIKVISSSCNKGIYLIKVSQNKKTNRKQQNNNQLAYLSQRISKVIRIKRIIVKIRIGKHKEEKYFQHFSC